MFSRRSILAACSVLTLTGVAGAAEYPDRPITLIVPWGSGGGADQIARVVARLFESELKDAVPVVNIPGATGQTGLTKMLTSPPDGYTVEVMTADTFALQVQPSPRFKLDQLTLLGIMIQQQSGIFVSQDSPLKTWVDAVEKAKTSGLKVAVTGFGSPDDLAVVFLRSQGLKLTSIPFQEPGLRYSSVMGGQADLLYSRPGDMRGLVDGKQVRPLIFFSEKPVAEFPNTPTSHSLGYNVSLPQFRALTVRAGTPPDRVKLLSETLAKIAKDEEYTQQLSRQMADPHGFVPARDAAAYVDKWLDEARAIVVSTKSASQ